MPKLTKLTRQVTTRQAASHCQVAISTLKRWIQMGTLGAVRTPGGHYRVEIGEFQRFLRDQRLPPYPGQAPGETRILIADDDHAVLRLLVEGLANDSRAFKLQAAGDGFEALVKIGFFKPALLILDISMPRMDGIEVCRRLKTQPETRAIQILGITGYSEKIAALMNAGADGCLAKPFALAELKNEVDRLLSRRLLNAV